MHHKKIKALLVLLTIFAVSVSNMAISAPASAPPAQNASAPVVPGPNDGRIAYITARLLEEYHYSQELLDTEHVGKIF